jgi:hypothetical protein
MGRSLSIRSINRCIVAHLTIVVPNLQWHDQFPQIWGFVAIGRIAQPPQALGDPNDILFCQPQRHFGHLVIGSIDSDEHHPFKPAKPTLPECIPKDLPMGKQIVNDGGVCSKMVL